MKNMFLICKIQQIETLFQRHILTICTVVYKFWTYRSLWTVYEKCLIFQEILNKFCVLLAFFCLADYTDYNIMLEVYQKGC